MFRKETPWDSSPVSTHACRAPPARLPPTIDRTTAPSTASILRHSTIRRPRTSAQHCGCSARVRWAKARISSSKHSLITGNPRSRPHRITSIRPSCFVVVLPDGSPAHPADNYYNPFGVDLPYCPSPPGRGRQPQDRAGGRSVARADRARRQRRPLDVGGRAPERQGRGDRCRERLRRAVALGPRAGSIRAG